MLKTWAGFIEFLEANGCSLVDETDWNYPIYRSSVGRFVGLDLDEDLDDFVICAVCNALAIDVPDQHNQPNDLVKELREGFKNFPPPASHMS